MAGPTLTAEEEAQEIMRQIDFDWEMFDGRAETYDESLWTGAMFDLRDAIASALRSASARGAEGWAKRDALAQEWEHRLPGLVKRWVGYEEYQRIMDRDDVEFINTFNPSVIADLLSPSPPPSGTVEEAVKAERATPEMVEVALVALNLPSPWMSMDEERMEAAINAALAIRARPQPEVK